MELSPVTPTPRQTHDTDSAVALHYDLTAILCEEFSLDELPASALAGRILHGLRARLGSREVYIPCPDRADRDAGIRRDFNGNNLSEVCRRYGVSASTVYRAVR
jgi:Mor family transcriptional regulator